MTLAEFLKNIFGYYGSEYTLGQSLDTMDYLSGLPANLLPYIAKAVKKIPLYGKKLPMIAEYEMVKQEAIAEHQHKVSLAQADSQCLRIEGPREDLASPEQLAEIRTWMQRLTEKTVTL